MELWYTFCLVWTPIGHIYWERQMSILDEYFGDTILFHFQNGFMHLISIFKFDLCSAGLFLFFCSLIFDFASRPIQGGQTVKFGLEQFVEFEGFAGVSLWICLIIAVVINLHVIYCADVIVNLSRHLNIYPFSVADRAEAEKETDSLV